MSAPEPTRYRLPCPGRLRVLRWDDECVVYDDASGDTHLLAGLAERVFNRLQAGPATEEDLLPGAEDEGVLALQDVLRRLRRIGLCESGP